MILSKRHNFLLKVATLGDCYYCVSGCPEPREDHVKNCVLMGLAMINAIEEFDEDNQEQVDMRVGVHSVQLIVELLEQKNLNLIFFQMMSH